MGFFHAKEHLCEFANGYFKEREQARKWIDLQSDLLIDKGVSPVIKALEGLGASKEKERLLNYYRKNEKRMQYRSFKEKGL